MSADAQALRRMSIGLIPRIGTLLMLVIISASIPLGAQVPDTTVVVTEPQDTSTAPRSVRMAPIVITATKVPIERNKLGFALTVISSEELAARQPLYAADALRDVAGAFIDEAVGPGGPTIVRLRGGEEVFTQILMDGLQVNQNGGFFDFQGLTLTNVERVEVARGPQSAVYGSSAVSGVVNFITRSGRPGPPGLELTTEAGGATENGGSFRSALATAGGTERVLYSAGLGTTYYRGIYDLAHDTWTRDGSIRLDAMPSDRWDLTGMFRFISVDSKLPVRDPGATRVPLDPNARDERDRLISSIRASFHPSLSSTHSLTASLYREHFVFEDQSDGVSGTDFFVFDANFTLRSVLRRSTLEYVGTTVFTTGPSSELGLVYGAQWEREDLTDRTGGDFGEGELGLDRMSGAAFGEIRADLGARLHLLTGARIEKFQGLEAQFTPRASAVFDAVPGLLSLRTAAGRAYKAPNLQEQFLDNPFIVSNPNLDPETSLSLEFGGDVLSRDGRFRAGLTFFHQDFDNLIRSVTLEGDTLNRQINRNLGESRAIGAELDIRYYAPHTWSVGLSWAWTKTKILNNSGLPDAEFPLDSVLPFRPEYQGSGFVEVVPREGLSILMRGIAVGPQVVLTERFSGRRDELDPYFLLGLTANFDVSPVFRIYSRAENLLNKRYQTAFDRMGIPTTFIAGVRLRR